MIKLLLALLSFPLFAQSPMDQHRWYLEPRGQEVLVSIDDLHDEVITAVPEMDWGRSLVPGLKLKKEVIIAVIDGGIEIEHPELKDHIAYNSTECHEGNIIPPKDGEDKDSNGYKGDCAGWDFVEDHNRPEDQDGHGTHVTGVINSVMNGVQGSYKFLPLRVFAPDEGRQTVKASAPLSTRLVRAFEYAMARKVDVIHLSVGWPKSFMTHELEETIKRALKEGISVVAAAGNSSQRATIWPCQMEGVICVGALRANGEVARFSNWGSQVDIFAPGEKILSTIPHTLAPLHISRKGYDFKNGTSQAAPFISATLALLRGLDPEVSSEELYGRLMNGARKAIGDKGIKGLFQLSGALRPLSGPFVLPRLKGLHSVVVDSDGRFALKFGLKNFGTSSEESLPVSLSCEDVELESALLTLPLTGFLEETLTFKGQILREVDFLHCELMIGEQKLGIRPKVLHRLNRPLKQMMVKQDELLVVNTRTGGRSRFMTLAPLKGTLPAPFYYVTGAKDLMLYKLDQKLGTIKMEEGCNFLRAWQLDLDRDGENEFMVESMCDKTHLYYQFYDQSLSEVLPGAKYKPAITIMNYEDFELVSNPGLPPSFRFVNVGFELPPESPWESGVTSQALHYYELFPAKGKDGWIYDVRILENPKEWVKSLNLRYLPSYQVFHELNGRLLIKLGQKTAWVDIKTQKASWAGLDDLLLLGSKKQELIGTDESVLQSFLTPYEYRGYVLSGVKLRFRQEDRFDPILDVLGTAQNELGYLTVLRTFQHLVFLQYDFSGNLLSQRESVVDRFDFLTAQDLMASVVNLPFGGKMIQLVDGTKVNTNNVDVVKDGGIQSFEIPMNCVTQQPVILDDKPVLPVFCGRTRHEFEMRFIEL